MTAAQVEEAEALMGEPIDAWRQASKGRLYPILLHILEGQPVESYADVPFRELVARVQLEDDDPKRPSESS